MAVESYSKATVSLLAGRAQILLSRNIPTQDPIFTMGIPTFSIANRIFTMGIPTF